MIALVTSSAMERISGFCPSTDRLIGTAPGESGGGGGARVGMGAPLTSRASEPPPARRLAPGDRRPAVATAVDRVQRGRQVARLGVFREVHESRRPPRMFTSSGSTSRRIASSTFCLRAWTTRAFERRSATMSGVPSATPPSSPTATDGRGGAPGAGGTPGTGGEAMAAPPRIRLKKNWVRSWANSLGVRMLERDDLRLLESHRHVHDLQDFQDAADIGGGVGEDEEVGLPVGADRALGGDVGAQERGRVGGTEILQRHDLGDDLAACRIGSGLAAHHGAQGRLRRALASDDAIDVVGLDRGEPVRVEDGQQEVQDLFTWDLAHRLQGHLPAAHVRSEDVVEARDLGGRLHHHLDVRVVEVEHDHAWRIGGGRGSREQEHQQEDARERLHFVPRGGVGGAATSAAGSGGVAAPGVVGAARRAATGGAAARCAAVGCAGWGLAGSLSMISTRPSGPRITTRSSRMRTSFPPPTASPSA